MKKDWKEHSKVIAEHVTKYNMPIEESLRSAYIFGRVEMMEEMAEKLDKAIGKYNPWPEQTYGGDEFYDEIVEIFNRIKNK